MSAEQRPAFCPRVPCVTRKHVPCIPRASAQRPGAGPRARELAPQSKGSSAGRGAVKPPRPAPSLWGPDETFGVGEPRGLRLQQVWGTPG